MDPEPVAVVHALTWFLAWQRLEPRARLPPALMPLAAYEEGELFRLLQSICRDGNLSCLRFYDDAWGPSLAASRHQLFRNFETALCRRSWGPTLLGQVHALIETCEEEAANMVTAP